MLQSLKDRFRELNFNDSQISGVTATDERFKLNLNDIVLIHQYKGKLVRLTPWDNFEAYRTDICKFTNDNGEVARMTIGKARCDKIINHFKQITAPVISTNDKSLIINPKKVDKIHFNGECVLTINKKESERTGSDYFIPHNICSDLIKQFKEIKDKS